MKKSVCLTAVMMILFLLGLLCLGCSGETKEKSSKKEVAAQGMKKVIEECCVATAKEYIKHMVIANRGNNDNLPYADVDMAMSYSGGFKKPSVEVENIELLKYNKKENYLPVKVQCKVTYPTFKRTVPLVKKFEIGITIQKDDFGRGIVTKQYPFYEFAGL